MISGMNSDDTGNGMNSVLQRDSGDIGNGMNSVLTTE